MIGIDPGGRKLAVVDLSRGLTATCTAKRTGSRGDELGFLARWLEGLGLTGPVWVEAPVVAGVRNLQTALSLAQTTGVVHSLSLETHQVPVASWKQRTVGKGNADKEAVRQWLDSRHPQLAAACGQDQDLYDATCIALYGVAVQDALDAGGFGTPSGVPDSD